MSLLRNICIALFLCISIISTAQERLTVSGVEYIVHEVEKKQTLYAISKVYSVPLDAILNSNPSVAGGLNAGQRLLIPVAAISKKAQKTAPVLKNGELTHTVRKKETWYSIAKQYQIDLADLLARNVDKSDGLRQGDSLVIPTEKVRSLDSRAKAEASAEGGRFHKVVFGETLYSISKLHEIELEELKELNGLAANEISIGSILRLPEEIVVEEPKELFPSYDLKRSYNIGFYLPFSLDRNDSVYVDNGKEKLYPLTDIAMQFYFGALVALDSLKALGLNAQVFFEDVNQNATSVSALRNKGDVEKMDLIIGPFHRKAVEKVAMLTKERNIPVVCPVTQGNRILMDKPNVFKAKSGRVEQIDAITTYASTQNIQGNVIIFMPDLESEKELQEMALKSLKLKMPGIQIHEIHNILDAAKFKTHFQLNKVNSVIIPSENHSVVSGLLTKLNGIADQHPMVVYGLQKWADFENIDLAYKEKLNVHLAMSDWVDRSDPRTQAFVSAFRADHHNDPSDYAFLGYDVTLYFGYQLLTKGGSFGQDIAAGSGIQTLHMPIEMRSTGIENGMRNVGITLVDHHEMVLRKVQAPRVLPY